VKIRRGWGEYRTLRGWIADGLPVGHESAPRVVSLKMTPRERRLDMQARQQIRAVATYSDGRQVDVTRHAKFQSNNDGLVSISEFGLVIAGETPGEAAVMASYMGAVDVFQILIPRETLKGEYPRLPVNNFIDSLVDAKLKKLNIAPSEMCDDAEFLRRVYLDVIGMLPTAEEARRFLSEEHSDRRERRVDELLKRFEFADYWA